MVLLSFYLKAFYSLYDIIKISSEVLLYEFPFNLKP
jgi:hypothetical protein